MAIARRIQTTVLLDGNITESNIIFHTLEERPDFSVPSPASNVFVLRDLWPQVNGSAESWPQWARDDYLKEWGNPCGNTSGGGDTHLFGVVIGTAEQCGVLHGKSYIGWTDGFAKLDDPGYQNYHGKRADETHGWVNWFNSNGYYPDQGQRGPWCWCPLGLSDVVDGGGLPYNRHVSWFAVWEQMRYADYLIEVGDVQPPQPPPPPSLDTPDIEFTKALALAFSTSFTRMQSEDDGVIYTYMTAEELATKAVETERLIRGAYAMRVRTVYP